MDNQDTLFNQIKSAAENAESKDFSSMDKVWNRVEEKLDQKVLKKETKIWKKVAVAASVLLVVSVGYQFLKEDQTTAPQNHSVVATDSIKTEKKQKDAVVQNDAQNPILKENAATILEKQINKPQQVVANEAVTTKVTTPYSDKAASTVEAETEATSASPATHNWIGNRKFKERGVSYIPAEASPKSDHVQNTQEAKVATKAEPIVIIDGEVSTKSVSELEDEIELDTFVALPNPLYIINNEYFTEEELFGPNPTSPYAPLKKQKIESTTIINPEKALTIYGEKGKNGVVIITTKNSKPAVPKKK